MGTVKVAMGVTQFPTGKQVFSREVELPATLYGLLAVHRRSESDDYCDRYHDRWRVTHAPTGLLVMDLPTKALAVKAAKALQGFPWAEVNVKNAKRWKHRKAVLEAVQKLRDQFRTRRADL